MADRPGMALVFANMRPKKEEEGEGESSPGLAAAGALRAAKSDEDALAAFEELYNYCHGKRVREAENEGGGGGTRDERRDGGR